LPGLSFFGDAMHRGATLRLTVAFLTGCGAVISAQQSPPVFRSRVDVIEIEMRAVDASGNSVTNLDQSEVEVLEDGRRQEIVAFSRVSVPVPGSDPGVSPAVLPVPPPRDVSTNRVAGTSRIFVLVLDDLHVDSRNTMQVKQAARRFVERHVAPGDLVSVVYTGVRPDAAQDFTSDRTLLLAAIDKFVGRKLRPATIERMEQYNTFFRARGRPRFEDLRDPDDAQRAFNARSAMASIESISGVLARVSGRRKAALLFSEGLDYDLSGLRSRGRIPGGDGPTVLPTTAPTGGSEADAVGRPDVHNYNHDVLLSLQAAMGAASRANLAIYSMDVRGDTSDTMEDLGAPVQDPSLGLTPQHVVQEMRDAQETLAVISDNTGGFATLSPSHYDAAFSRIVGESSEYYLLAYSPWNPAPDGKYRAIDVRVKRPGVRVSARDGYYAPRQRVKRPLKFVGDGISDETSAIVMAPIPAAGLPLDVHVAAFKHDRKKADIVVTAQVDGRELADESRFDVNNTLEMALIAIDSAGAVHAATSRAIDVRLDSRASRIMRQAGYRVVSRVQLPPGRYQIRQAVRERSGGRHGSVFADIDIPDFAKTPAISGILLTSGRSNAVPTSVDPETYARLAVLPSVRRTFSPGDELIALAEIYHSPRNRDVTLVTLLVDAGGREIYRRALTLTPQDMKDAAGVHRQAVQIPLRDARGDLMLTFEVRPDGSENVVTRSIAFSVAPPTP
jgi:VWFA-related protein